MKYKFGKMKWNKRATCHITANLCHDWDGRYVDRREQILRSWKSELQQSQREELRKGGEDGVDLGIVHGSCSGDRSSSGLASNDDIPEHQESRQGISGYFLLDFRLLGIFRGYFLF